MSDDFVRNIQRQHAALGQFIELLEQEQALLTSTPVAIDTLSRLTERKAEQAKELDALDETRRAILVAHGYASNLAGGEQFAAALGCTPLWQDFIARVDTARTQNQLSGVAIDNRLDLTNRALAFLQKATGQTFYGPNGRTRAHAGRHSIRRGV